MSKDSLSIQPGAPDMRLSSTPKAMRTSVRTLVAVAMKRPPGKTRRSEGSSPANLCGWMEATSNRRGCGAVGDRVVGVWDPATDCDSAERCNDAMANGSRRVRDWAVRKDFLRGLVITMLPTESRVQKF